MARVYSDGAEYDDLLFWDYAFNVNLSSGRMPGTYAYNPNVCRKYIPSEQEYYIRFAAKCASSSAGIIFKFLGNSDAATQCYLYYDYNSSSYLLYSGDGTLYGSSSHSYPYGYWHLIEIHLKIDNAPNGVAELKVNGISEVSFTGDTQPYAYTTIDAFQFYYIGNIDMHYDDIALNNISGGVDDSWPGDEHYELHPANDNGDVNDWTGSDGDKVNNYAMVDEVPPTGDTDYVKSETPAERDMYKITPFTDTGKIVTRIWSECRARDSNPSAGEIKIGFKTGGTVYLCSTDRVLQSAYTRVVGDEALVNPADSAVWEKADIDALQFVGECE